MDLADQTCYRTLNYIGAISKQGYILNAGQVRAYARRSRRLRRTGSSAAATTRALLERLGGQPQAEEPLVWLYRVNWIDLIGPTDTFEDDDEVKLTPLGRAALAALDDAALAAKDAPAASIALDKDDPIALAKVIGRFAEAGPGALIDRYFREEAFVPIVQRTEIQRILMGPEGKGRVAAIEQALTDYKIDRSFEVRIDDNDEYHDRYLIPEEGPVWALGTSVSGVGTRHSAMVEIKDEAVVQGMRANFKRVWNAARTLNPPIEPSAEPAEKKTGDGSTAAAGNGTEPTDGTEAEVGQAEG